MSLRHVLFICCLLALLFWGIVAGIINYTSPEYASWLVLVLLYASATLAMGSTFLPLNFYLRMKLKSRAIILREFNTALRQSILIGLLGLFLLLLARYGYFTVLNAIVLCIVLTLIEYMISNKN
jgi:hypothetical protein